MYRRPVGDFRHTETYSRRELHEVQVYEYVICDVEEDMRDNNLPYVFNRLANFAGIRQLQLAQSSTSLNSEMAFFACRRYNL